MNDQSERIMQSANATLGAESRAMTVEFLEQKPILCNIEEETVT